MMAGLAAIQATGKAGRLETGEIVFQSWGYSMVLPTWWKVLKGAKVGGFAIIQQLEAEIVSHDGYGQAGVKRPTAQLSAHYPAERRKVTSRNGVLMVGTQYGAATVWDGKPKGFDTYD
jgi:hypothetical protein